VSYTTNASGKKTSHNIIGSGGNIVATKRYEGEYADKLYVYGKDTRGSVTSIYGEGGGFITGYDYDDFGQTETLAPVAEEATLRAGAQGTQTATSSTEVQNPFYNEVCYTGGIYDESTGLYYLNARYYDPADGRFITVDSYRGDVSDPSTLHRYAYCANNPVNFVDPSGHYKKWSLKLLNSLSDYCEPKYHYFRNIKLNYGSEFDGYGMLNGQSIGYKSYMDYGAQSISSAGCGPIAIYNSAKTLGKTQELQEIIFELEYNGIYLNRATWGTDPNRVNKYFSKHGMSTKRYSNTGKFVDKIRKGGVFMMAYFTGHGINAHYVALRSYSNGSVRVSSLENHDQRSRDYDSVDEIFTSHNGRYKRGKGKKTTYSIYKTGKLIKGYEVKRR
jgi:RHS repeat-associated protein